MTRSLHVGAAQICAKFNDFRGNLDLIGQFASEARQAGVEALLFSECVLHGGTIAPEAARLAVPADGPECWRIAELARREKLVLLVGFNERAGAQVFNSYLIAYPDGRTQVQRKLALNAKELAAGFTAGPAARLPVDISGVRCRMIICADWGSQAVLADVDRSGCDVAFLGTAGGGTTAGMLRQADLLTEEGMRAYEERMQRVSIPLDAVRYCARNRRALVCCNCVGDNGFDQCQEGHSMIIDRTGAILGLIPGAPVLEHQRSQLVHAVVTIA